MSEHKDQWNSRECLKINPHIYAQLLFHKGVKTIQQRKNFKNKQTKKGNGKTGNPHAKKTSFWTSLIYVTLHIRLHICYTTYKNKLKVDHTPHLKAKTIKFLQENIRATFHDLGFSCVSQI